MQPMTCPNCHSAMKQPPNEMTGWLVYRCECGTATDYLIDGLDWPDETNEPCDCGIGGRMRGYRACQACAQARLTYPHLFEGEPPDQLDTREGELEGEPG